jgi:hypothetical protein
MFRINFQTNNNNLKYHLIFVINISVLRDRHTTLNEQYTIGLELC